MLREYRTLLVPSVDSLSRNTVWGPYRVVSRHSLLSVGLLRFYRTPTTGLTTTVSGPCELGRVRNRTTLGTSWVRIEVPSTLGKTLPDPYSEMTEKVGDFTMSLYSVQKKDPVDLEMTLYLHTQTLLPVLICYFQLWILIVCSSSWRRVGAVRHIYLWWISIKGELTIVHQVQDSTLLSKSSIDEGWWWGGRWGWWVVYIERYFPEGRFSTTIDSTLTSRNIPSVNKEIKGLVYSQD